MGIKLATDIKPDSMLAYRLKEHARLDNDLSAYELLTTAKVYEPLARKYERLVRAHRQHVFDARSGDAHSRAIGRLQRTITSKAMAFDRWAGRQERVGRELTRMGY